MMFSSPMSTSAHKYLLYVYHELYTLSSTEDIQLQVKETYFSLGSNTLESHSTQHSSFTAEVQVQVKVAQSCPTLCDPMVYTVPGILWARILEWVAFPFSRGSFQPRDPTQVSCIAGRSLPAESQGKPKNTGVGSLSLLQWLFPTQESNQSLLHCRWILYQLILFICLK